MSKKLIGLILVTAFLLLPVQGLAAEWFVRPGKLTKTLGAVWVKFLSDLAG